jgi:hypothetical protein
MDIIKYDEYSDSPDYIKGIEQLIVETVNTKSIIALNIYSSAIRKHFHKFARANGFFHVSYCDSSRMYETNNSYWCDICKKYINSNDYKIVHCCSDEHCGEYLIVCEYRHAEYESDDDEVIIGNESGAYYDVKKTKRTNNIIVISNKIELLTDIFKKKNISKPLEWIKKREIALN